MKLVIINGTQIKGCTYHIKELYLASFRKAAHEIKEFYSHKSMPPFCIGCKRCLSEDEALCPPKHIQCLLECDDGCGFACILCARIRP